MTLPHLVARILSTDADGMVLLTHVFKRWARQNRERGQGEYAGKIGFAIREAIDDGAEGIVAVVDRDTARPRARLTELQKGREGARFRGHRLPAALGEAAPHMEAWLLADGDAVKKILHLNPKRALGRAGRSPKGRLDHLWRSSPRSSDERRDSIPVELLAEIAREVGPEAIETRSADFREFARDVRNEVGSICQSRGVT
jgi:hypothetical protein